MRVTTFKCDGCGIKLSEGDESRERCFTLATPFSSADLDICRECWEKMLNAIGKTWDRSERRMVPRELA